MEIKRTTEIYVETNRRFVIRQPESVEPIACPNCNEPMLAAEQIARIFGISQRRIFQLIETGAAHYAETETGVMMLCAASLADAIGGDAKNLPAE